MVNADWCFASDRHGNAWIECDGKTREEAIAEAVEYAKSHGFTPARIGYKRGHSHADFVGGLGADVRERITDRACDEVGDYAEEYPDMKSAPFDEALEAFVLDWLRRNVPEPRFFSVEGEEEIPV